MGIYNYILDAIYALGALVFIPLFFHIYRVIKTVEKEPNNEERNKKIYEDKKLKKKIWILITLMFIMVAISFINFIIKFF